MSEIDTSGQPAPQAVKGAVPVHNLMHKEIMSMTVMGEEDFLQQNALLRGLNMRDEFGRGKYGVPLMVPNGRDFLKDTLDELLDAPRYMRGLIAEICPEYRKQSVYGQLAQGAPLELIEIYHEYLSFLKRAILVIDPEGRYFEDYKEGDN